MPEVQEIRHYRVDEVQRGNALGKQLYTETMQDIAQRNHRQRYRAERLKEYHQRFRPSDLKWLLK